MKRATGIVLTFLLFLLATVIFATWQYRLLCLLLCLIINKKWLLAKVSVLTYRIWVTVTTIAIIIAIPNYFQRGRTKAVYIDFGGHSCATPLPVYLTNIILPEKEIMNLGMKLNALVPSCGNKLMDDARHDFWTGRSVAFYQPYNNLSLQGSNPGSLAVMQGMNQILGTSYEGIYVTKPKNFDAEREYPVVIFAHGFLGNWELYQGILSGLNNCIREFGIRYCS